MDRSDFATKLNWNKIKKYSFIVFWIEVLVIILAIVITDKYGIDNEIVIFLKATGFSFWYIIIASATFLVAKVASVLEVKESLSAKNYYLEWLMISGLLFGLGMMLYFYYLA